MDQCHRQSRWRRLHHRGDELRTSLQHRPHLHWERHYHGSALAAVALGLSPMFAYVCIPSAFWYRHLIAHGSTPLVDEISTERLQVVHTTVQRYRGRRKWRELSSGTGI